MFQIYHAYGSDARIKDRIMISIVRIHHVGVCVHENRAIIMGIKTGKPLETLAVVEDGFARLRASHGGCDMPPACR